MSQRACKSKSPALPTLFLTSTPLVRIYIRDKNTGVSVACLETNLSNGKTVDQPAVGWATAVIAGLGLVAAGITSGLGHTNTAAHVAANAVSLFGYFQSQAVVGMTAVTMPPIVQSWTQNFQWSMGIVRVGFLQSDLHLVSESDWRNANHISVHFGNRIRSGRKAIPRHCNGFGEARFSLMQLVPSTTSRSVVPLQLLTKLSLFVVMIVLVSELGIEQTNIFLTGLIFFVVVCCIVALCVALFKGFCEVAVKAEWMKTDKFSDFRNGWKIVLKGILFRLVSTSKTQANAFSLTLPGSPRLCSDERSLPVGAC